MKDELDFSVIEKTAHELHGVMMKTDPAHQMMALAAAVSAFLVSQGGTDERIEEGRRLFERTLDAYIPGMMEKVRAIETAMKGPDGDKLRAELEQGFEQVHGRKPKWRLN
jgi:hypothetical protein